MTDRDPNYMYKKWGTTHLITDYDAVELREVVHDKRNKKVKTEETELFSLEDVLNDGDNPGLIIE